MNRIYTREEYRIVRTKEGKIRRIWINEEYDREEYRELFKCLLEDRIKDLEFDIEIVEEDIKHTNTIEEKENLRFYRDEFINELEEVKKYNVDNDNDCFLLDEALLDIGERKSFFSK